MTQPFSHLVFLCRRHKRLAIDIGTTVSALSIVAFVGAIMDNPWPGSVFVVALALLYFHAQLTAEHLIAQVKTMSEITKRQQDSLGELHREIDVLRDKLDNQIKVSRIKSLIGTKHPRKN